MIKEKKVQKYKGVHVSGLKSISRSQKSLRIMQNSNQYSLRIMQNSNHVA